MKTFFFFLASSFLFLLLPFIANAQSLQRISGVILDAKTNEPVQYVKIENRTTHKQVISNRLGVFFIYINNYRDTVIVQHIGYKDYKLRLEKEKTYYTVYLTAKSYELAEVTIKKKKSDYLYTLLMQCRDKMTRNNDKKAGKAYYELTSDVNGQRMEMIEAFYNAELKGQKLVKMNIKNGRFALQAVNDRLFVSMDGANILSQSDLFRSESFFPLSPMELSKQDMKRLFTLKLKTITATPTDTLWLLSFTPRFDNGVFWDGEILLNPSKTEIYKVNLHVNTRSNHPFLPLRETDSVLKVEMNIERSFTTVDSIVYLREIKFDYVTDYKSWYGTSKEYSYQIHTQGLVCVYDYQHLFQLPLFEFDPADDYYNISAISYNDFFWNYNDEAAPREHIIENDAFYFSPLSFKNTDLKFALDPNGIYRPPMKLFVHWDSERLELMKTAWVKKEKQPLYDPEKTMFTDNNRDVYIPNYLRAFADTTKIIGDETLILDEGNNRIFEFVQYDFGTTVFMDVDTYRDSTHVITATLLDPLKFKFK